MLISSFKRYLRFYRPNSFHDTAIFIIKDKYYTVLDIGGVSVFARFITSLLPVGNDFYLRGGGEEKKKKRKVYMVQYCSIFARKYAPGRR